MLETKGSKIVLDQWNPTECSNVVLNRPQIFSLLKLLMVKTWFSQTLRLIWFCFLREQTPSSTWKKIIMRPCKPLKVTRIVFFMPNIQKNINVIAFSTDISCSFIFKQSLFVFFSVSAKLHFLQPLVYILIQKLF